MPAFHQMGHDSENLLRTEGLNRFAGAILSPVNYDLDKIAQQIEWARSQLNFQTIFDPQLYVPNSERVCLREWQYFPNDVDTADLTSAKWWDGLLGSLVGICETLRPSALCSPAVLPLTYPDEYFGRMVEVGNKLGQRLEGTEIQAIQTAVVSMPELADINRSMTIASILSRSHCEHLYLVLVSQTEPRRELSEVEQLKGAMRLIAALRSTGLVVTVGFASSDIVLWKAAGATNCATGKFFNLRRFTKTRFEEPKGQGGGQLPYWFDESLMSFLRQSDLQRIIPINLATLSASSNPFASEIQEQLATEPDKAWLALAWRQFMFWFADIENRLDSGIATSTAILRNADTNWRTLEDLDFLMEERRNDGGWIRMWRRAIAESSL